MAALIGVGSGSISDPPPNCLGLGTKIVIDFDGKTEAIENLKNFKAVVMNDLGERSLMDAKVYRTKIFGEIEIFSYGKDIHVSGRHLLLLKKEVLRNASVYCRICKNGGEDYGMSDCYRCGCYSTLCKNTDYRPVIVKDWKENSPITVSKEVNVWYHVVLFDEDGNQSNLPFELAGDVYSEPFRTPIDTKRKWMKHDG